MTSTTTTAGSDTDRQAILDVLAWNVVDREVYVSLGPPNSVFNLGVDRFEARYMLGSISPARALVPGMLSRRQMYGHQVLREAGPRERTE